MSFPSAAALVLLALAPQAAAGPTARPIDEPDLEAARRHFVAGGQLYEAQDYAGALTEFEAAQKLAPSPAFDYNIARCFDRLERYAEAAEAYRRYLGSSPEAPDAAEVRERVRRLRARVGLPPVEAAATEPGAAPPRRRSRLAPILVGGGTLAAAAIAAGLLGSVAVDYDTLQGGCGMTTAGCAGGDVDSLVVRADVGWVALAVAGALAVVDAVLWIRAARR